MTGRDTINFSLRWTALCTWACLLAGCQPLWYWQEADKTATNIIQQQQIEAFGEPSPFTIERPVDTLRRRLMIGQDLPRSGPASLGVDQLPTVEHWPKEARPPVNVTDSLAISVYPDGTPLKLALVDALQIAAGNARDYQTRKEAVYTAALGLDLADDEFRNTFAGALDWTQTHNLTDNATVRGNEYNTDIAWSKALETGASITAGFAFDLVKLLMADRDSSLGLLADATITVPLMRGAGRHIVTEPRTQAQRDVVYALYTFERFKRTLAVSVASEYLAVLQQLDQVANAADNYKRLIDGGRRARRLADAGRLPEIQVDQAHQDELRARDRWIAARQSYQQRLDRFKITLGLPTDADIELDAAELESLAEIARQRLAEKAATVGLPADDPLTAADGEVHLVPPSTTGGPLEMPPTLAVEIALDNRLDLQISIGRVYDAQRNIVVAANSLEMGLTFTGTGAFGSSRSLGSAGLPNAQLRPENGRYGFGLSLDLPFERTREQNTYRTAFIALQQRVRSVQQLEDQIKLDIRNALRKLLQSRESFMIQGEALAVAERRVDSTTLFLQAGRAEVRDVLESQEALIDAQNALTASLVNYRVAELELQRDLGVLEVDNEGLWHEYTPGQDDSQ